MGPWFLHKGALKYLGLANRPLAGLKQGRGSGGAARPVPAISLTGSEGPGGGKGEEVEDYLVDVLVRGERVQGGGSTSSGGRRWWGTATAALRRQEVAGSGR
jgi:hypothetical protein